MADYTPTPIQTASMGVEKKISFSVVAGTYLNRYSTSSESDILINAGLYLSQSPNARSPAMLVPRLGKTDIKPLPGCRGCFYSNTLQTVLVVTENELLSLNTWDWSSTVLKELDNPQNYAPLFEEGYSSVGSDAAGAVVWISGNGFFRIYKNSAGNLVVADVPTANLDSADFTSLTFIDGYILASVRGTRKFIRSELNGSKFSDGINFSATQANDNIINIAQLNRELFLFSERHTEVWWNAGSDQNQPFVRQDGRVYPIGILSENTVHLNGALYNFGAADDNTTGVYKWTSQGYEKVSFDYLDYLGTLASRIRLTGTLERNQTIINVHLDVEGRTEIWSYYVDTKSWSKRESWDTIDVFSVRGQFYGIDETGIFKIEGDTDRGTEITCTKQCAVQHVDEKLVFYNLLELDIAGEEHGLVTLDISDDGGATWRNTGFSADSKRGSYNRLRFNRLGASRSRVFRFRWVGVRVLGAYLDADVGTK